MMTTGDNVSTMAWKPEGKGSKKHHMNQPKFLFKMNSKN
jgi:hypothetical protein